MLADFHVGGVARGLRPAVDGVVLGRRNGTIVFRIIALHALRNALIPVVTVIGLQVGVLFTGAILTETIFSWPGIGKWMVASVTSRDYPVIQGGLLLIAACIVFVNMVLDVVYAIINPRLRSVV